MTLRTLKSGIMAFFLFFALAVPALPTLAPVAQAADSKKAACEGVGLTGGECNGAAASDTVSSLVATIVNLLSVAVGIVAVIMIIIAGFKYITASGDTSKISSAKSTLIYAIIGLIVVALAQFIVNFVLESV